MENLRAFTLSLCKNIRDFILALDPDPNPLNPIPCPNLKALLFRIKERFDIENMVDVASARAERGVPFESIKIVTMSGAPLTPKWGVTELQKHVLQVVTGFRVRYEVWGCDNDRDLEY